MEQTQQNFGMSFSNGNKLIKITLVNQDDVFKLADIFINMLLDNNIEFTREVNDGTADTNEAN